MNTPVTSTGIINNLEIIELTIISISVYVYLKHTLYIFISKNMKAFYHFLFDYGVSLFNLNLYVQISAFINYFLL